VGLLVAVIATALATIGPPLHAYHAPLSQGAARRIEDALV